MEDSKLNDPEISKEDKLKKLADQTEGRTLLEALLEYCIPEKEWFSAFMGMTQEKMGSFENELRRRHWKDYCEWLNTKMVGNYAYYSRQNGIIKISKEEKGTITKADDIADEMFFEYMKQYLEAKNAGINTAGDTGFPRWTARKQAIFEYLQESSDFKGDIKSEEFRDCYEQIQEIRKIDKKLDKYLQDKEDKLFYNTKRA